MYKLRFSFLSPLSLFQLVRFTFISKLDSGNLVRVYRHPRSRDYFLNQISPSP